MSAPNDRRDQMSVSMPRLLISKRSNWMVLVILLASASQLCAIDVQLQITDAPGGDFLPARVRVRDAAGKDHVPVGAPVVAIGADAWFICDGHAQMDLPPGDAVIRVEHGTEYSPYRKTVSIADKSPQVISIPLQRWIDMHKLGYVCGENHLHVSAEALAPQLVAEGLDFGTSMQWWNGPKFDPPKGDGFERILRYAGREVPTSVFDFEIEHEWGAAYATGLPRPLQETSKSNRPNLPLVRAAHEAGALVAYQAGYSREVLLDALLGYVDVVNVCSNNFLRHRFQPRSRYSNLLDVEGFRIYPETDEGMMHLSMDSYYRLLNCGLRLVVGAESATGAKKNPVGYNRTYVRAGQNPKLPDFLAAWREGRNFVTNGPMIMLTIDGNKEPGDTIAFGAGGGELSIQAQASADQTLTSLEIVVNGQAISMKPEMRGRKGQVEAKVPIREGSWITARCTERDDLVSDGELETYTFGREARPSRLRFAQTSPIYVTVDGKGPRVQRSIDEAGRILDAFEQFAMRVANAQYHDLLRSALAQARNRLTGR